MSNGYFQWAEGEMEASWNAEIWPMIKAADFSSVLEIAAGVGRNTERLASVSKKIIAVDMNAFALDQARKRFEGKDLDCEIEFFKNDGMLCQWSSPIGDRNFDFGRQTG